MATVTIYGASDDLIEVEGDLREEFYALDEGGMSLAFGDGTILDVRYDDHGIWRITRGFVGSASFEKQEALGDDGNREDGKPAYSDVVTLTGELLWVFGGEKVAMHKIEATASV
jgi:hypothetical protein